MRINSDAANTHARFLGMRRRIARRLRKEYTRTLINWNACLSIGRIVRAGSQGMPIDTEFYTKSKRVSFLFRASPGRKLAPRDVCIPLHSLPIPVTAFHPWTFASQRGRGSKSTASLLPFRISPYRLVSRRVRASVCRRRRRLKRTRDHSAVTVRIISNSGLRIAMHSIDGKYSGAIMIWITI